MRWQLIVRASFHYQNGLRTHSPIKLQRRSKLYFIGPVSLADLGADDASGRSVERDRWAVWTTAKAVALLPLSATATLCDTKALDAVAVTLLDCSTACFLCVLHSCMFVYHTTPLYLKEVPE